jgi:mono/diheme cytochrome c family protein
MKSSKILLVSILVGVLGCPLFAQKGDPEAGKAIFAKRCSNCHGAAGEGKEEIAKLLKVDMRPLSSKEVQAQSDSDFRKIVSEGKGKMKPIKDVTDRDFPNLIAYLRTLARQ